eukprot:3672327-Rhodomonas_salina.1
MGNFMSSKSKGGKKAAQISEADKAVVRRNLCCGVGEGKERGMWGWREAMIAAGALSTARSRACDAVPALT